MDLINEFIEAFQWMLSTLVMLVGGVVAIGSVALGFLAAVVIVSSIFDGITTAIGKRIKKPRTRIGKILRRHADGV